MTLRDAIKKARETKQAFRRKDWSHADWLIIRGSENSYGGGELFWEATGMQAQLFYCSDFIKTDWIMKSKERP